jgi:hypothetical protein
LAGIGKLRNLACRYSPTELLERLADDLAKSATVAWLDFALIHFGFQELGCPGAAYLPTQGIRSAPGTLVCVIERFGNNLRVILIKSLIYQ